MELFRRLQAKASTGQVGHWSGGYKAGGRSEEQEASHRTVEMAD